MKRLLVLFVIIGLGGFMIEGLQPSYPILYVPGMFDNGDLVVPQSKMASELDSTEGFYYQSYFKNRYRYDQEPLVCSSNLIHAKYNRLVVANLIADYRTNISVRLMGERLYYILKGKPSRGQSENLLRNYKGNDFEGSCIRDGKIIHFKGLLEEIWAKYGKKVFYQNTRNGYRVVTNSNNTDTFFYENSEGYFNTTEEIGFNMLAHSSGGLALRHYMALCRRQNEPDHVKGMINLAVPQKGARMTKVLNQAFQKMMEFSADSFMKNLETGAVTITVKNGKTVTISYKTLHEETRIGMMHGNSAQARFMRSLVGNYILYQVAFDGRKRVLGTDPALYDLNPDHRFVKELNREPIRADIPIHNFYGISANAPLFQSIGRYLSLGKNDGVVDYRDTLLDHLPNSERLAITEIQAENVNHIPFPFIKPLFQLPETIEQYYGFLSILLKNKKDREYNEQMIQAVLEAIMRETGFELQKLVKEENYSIIDYYVDHPRLFE